MKSCEIKFMWNGVKFDGKLEKVHYSKSSATPDTITIYADGYGCTNLDKLGLDCWNDSDPYTDYFDKDKVRVSKGDWCFEQVQKAFYKQELHNAKRLLKGYERRNSKQEWIDEARAKVARLEELAA